MTKRSYAALAILPAAFKPRSDDVRDSPALHVAAQLQRLGAKVRVYLPYGAQWYGYLMRRLAERPANATFFARALTTRR